MKMQPLVYCQTFVFFFTRCEEGGQVLNRVILQVEKAVAMFQRLPNRAGDDEMIKLDLVRYELLNDYLTKHLLW